MRPDLRDRPVFICGHPKSGTSLLRALLDSHPQLIVYPEESAFFRRFLPQTKGQPAEQLLASAERLLIHIFTWNQTDPPPSQAGFPDRDYSSISFADVRQAMGELLAQWGYRHPGDILSAAVLAYGQVIGQWGEHTRWWVEKSPYNEHFAGQIFRWWPQAKCIHIVRDPRDNYLSYRRKHPDWRPEFFAANWRRSTRAGLGNLRKFGPQRYWMLRYEDLVQTPEACLGALREFLEIAAHPALNTPTRAGEFWRGNSMFAEEYQAISAAPVGRWREALDPPEAAVIEWMTRPWLKQMNYPRSASWSLKGFIRALSWPLRWRMSTWLNNLQ